MELVKIKIESFKKVASVELELADVTILVGANGCGKSSIIQATHLASCVLRQADRVDRSTSSTVGIEELDYLPTDSYMKLGHKANWGNRYGSPSTKVTFTFEKDAQNFVALCELRSARNAGISITGFVQSELVKVVRTKSKFFTAYIPGISGIPNKEEKKSRKNILKACSYGDSNIILRNALLLLKGSDGKGLRKIEEWLSGMVGPIIIDVRHDENNDLTIACDVTHGGVTRPIELIGTGYLQLIQIYTYIMLFNSKVVLIDEPDIHLHPTIQEKLVRALAIVARERNLRILLTTHSPFIVRGAPQGSKVYWINDGNVESVERKTVELALGWGAFGKKIIVISEDSKVEWLKKIFSQWQDIEPFATFYPGTGYSGIPTPEQAKEIYCGLGEKFKIFIHRDRDSLTDDEVNVLQHKYADAGVTLWFPEQSDIESYFCSSSFIAEVVGCSDSEADTYISTVLSRQQTPINEQFVKHRRCHNDELHPDGGGPENAVVWSSFQARQLKGAKGKFVHNQLKTIIPSGNYSTKSIMQHVPRHPFAEDLRTAILPLLR